MLFPFKTKRSFPLAHLLKVDMHSHILPGIDDGAKDIAASLDLIDGLTNMGYKKLITTPHIMGDLYPNTPKTIHQAYLHLKKEMDSAGYQIPLSYAAEYLIDEQFPQKIEEGLLCLSKNYVLIETMFSVLPPNIEDILFLLKAHHYIPVLAHPERYHYLNTDLKELDIFLKHGCKLQPNILSLAGYYGPAEKALFHHILDAGLIDFLGSDVHHPHHLEAIQNLKVHTKTANKLEEIAFENHLL